MATYDDNWTEEMEQEAREDSENFEREWREDIERQVDEEFEAVERKLRSGQITREGLRARALDLLSRMERKTRYKWLKSDAQNLRTAIENNAKPYDVVGGIKYHCEDFHLYLYTVACDATKALLKWEQKGGHLKTLTDELDEFEYWIGVKWSDMKMHDTGYGSFEP